MGTRLKITLSIGALLIALSIGIYYREIWIVVLSLVAAAFGRVKKTGSVAVPSTVIDRPNLPIVDYGSIEETEDNESTPVDYVADPSSDPDSVSSIISWTRDSGKPN